MLTDRARQRRAALVRQWEGSGESRRAFARRHGLTLWQFDSWKRQVRRDAARRGTAFAPVQLLTTSAAADAGVIDLTLVSGERLTIRASVSVDLVRAVLAVLRASC